MGHTNQTANYNLPQFVGTDKPSWLGDINDAFAAIDTAIAAAASEASTADGKADALGTTVSGHTTQIGTLQTTVTTQGNTLNTVTSLIGNGTPTTTDQTIIGAINELHADQGDLTDLQTTDKSSLVAAINEVAQGGGGSTAASAVSYDNTTSGLAATNVQAAIDELSEVPTTVTPVSLTSGTPYTLLHDAIVNVMAPSAASAGVQILLGATAIGYMDAYNNTSNSMFLKKGFTVKLGSNGTGTVNELS